MKFFEEFNAQCEEQLKKSSHAPASLDEMLIMNIQSYSRPSEKGRIWFHEGGAISRREIEIFSSGFGFDENANARRSGIQKYAGHEDLYFRTKNRSEADTEIALYIRVHGLVKLDVMHIESQTTLKGFKQFRVLNYQNGHLEEIINETNTTGPFSGKLTW